MRDAIVGRQGSAPSGLDTILKPANLLSSSLATGERAMQTISLRVNGREVGVTADADTPLLDILRNHLGLLGTKFGCGLEQCGCCMVLIDGRPEKSCGKGVATVAGTEITTVEGLGTPDHPHPLQQAFLDEQAGQCGYCLSGVLISAKALIDRNRAPSRREIAEALDENICRCGSHARILRAVALAAERMREGPRADGGAP
jgi:nicotinate dehydrogenase subunit A